VDDVYDNQGEIVGEIGYTHSEEWVARSQMFEDWPIVMGKLGAPKKKHWWSELWERGGIKATAKGMDET